MAQHPNTKPQQSQQIPASLPKIPEQQERPTNVELDPAKQQLKRMAPGPIQVSADIQQHQQHIQQAQNSMKGAVQPHAPVGNVEQSVVSRPNPLGSTTTPTTHTQGGQPLNISVHGSLGVEVNQQTAISPVGGVAIPGVGGGLLTTATPTSMLSNSIGNSVGLAAGHVMSHDPADDSVFSPGIVDDERMKLLERVSVISGPFMPRLEVCSKSKQRSCKFSMFLYAHYK